MKKRTSFLLKISLGLAILLFIIFRTGIPNLLQSLSLMNPLFIVLTALIVFTNYILKTISLKILLNPLKKVKFLDLFKYGFLSRSISILTPARIGELSLIYFLRKEDVEYSKGITIVFLDKLITVLITLFIALIASLILLPQIKNLILLLIAMIGVFILLINNSLIKRLILKLLGRHSKYYDDFILTLKNYLKNNRKELSLNIFLTLIITLTQSFAIFVLFLSLNAHPGFIYIFLIRAITFALSLVPLTPQGLGIKESVGIYLYQTIGIAPGISTSIYLINLAIYYGYSLLSLLIINIERKREILLKPSDKNSVWKRQN